MDTRLEALSDRLCRGLMRAYPPEFQQRFSEEMAQVYRSLCCQVYHNAGIGGLLRIWLSALLDFPMAALVQWGQNLTKRRMVSMQANPWEKVDGTIPLSSRQALLAALPFLLFGIASLAEKSEILRTSSASLPLRQVLLIHPYLVCGWLILIGLAAGIVTGFPRWAFSYLGWGVLYAWWWGDMGFYGYHTEGESWLVLLAVVVISLLIRRSIQPLRFVFSGLWRDLTLLSFGLYILYTHVYMVADSNHNPYLAFFILASALVASLGAWGFFRNASPMRRVLALVGGLFLAVVLGMINDATWDFAAYYGLPESSNGISLIGVIFFAGLAVFMLGFGLITRWRQNRMNS